MRVSDTLVKRLFEVGNQKRRKFHGTTTEDGALRLFEMNFPVLTKFFLFYRFLTNSVLFSFLFFYIHSEI